MRRIKPKLTQNCAQRNKKKTRKKRKENNKNKLFQWIETTLFFFNKLLLFQHLHTIVAPILQKKIAWYSRIKYVRRTYNKFIIAHTYIFLYMYYIMHGYTQYTIYIVYGVVHWVGIHMYMNQMKQNFIYTIFRHIAYIREENGEKKKLQTIRHWQEKCYYLLKPPTNYLIEFAHCWLQLTFRSIQFYIFFMYI